MRINDQMPELQASGKWINTSEIKTEELLIGRMPTLIYFWAVSCNYCEKLMPYIHRIRKEQGANLNIISIHTPLIKEDTDMQRIKSKADKYNIIEPLFVDQDEMLSKRFQINYVPAYFIFNQEGELKHFQSGRSAGSQFLLRRLERVLKK